MTSPILHVEEVWELSRLWVAVTISTTSHGKYIIEYLANNQWVKLSLRQGDTDAIEGILTVRSSLINQPDAYGYLNYIITGE